MRNLDSRKLILALVVFSVALYGVDYLIYGRPEEIGFGLLGNLAFLPIYVLFVTLMIERVLRAREREALRQKLNMVIGVFFSEVGTPLLRDGFSFVGNPAALSDRLRVTPQWTDADFRQAAAFLRSHPLEMDSRQGNLPHLKEFLAAKRGFMLGLLENPNLLEHDALTDLLWAVFHLVEELEARHSLDGLPAADLDHLSGDLKRAYTHLLAQWVAYLQHLKSDYPYLFSLAVRTNPLNPDARVELGSS